MSMDLWSLSDLTTPWCIRVVATLRIAHHIRAGVHDVDGLAEAAGCDARALSKVLSHLAGQGIFTGIGPGRFALNDAATGFLDPAQTIGLDLDGIGGRLSHVWATLPTYVRTGRPGYQERFGRPFWEDLDAHPELAASF